MYINKCQSDEPIITTNLEGTMRTMRPEETPVNTISGLEVANQSITMSGCLVASGSYLSRAADEGSILCKGLRAQR